VLEEEPTETALLITDGTKSRDEVEMELSERVLSSKEPASRCKVEATRGPREGKFNVSSLGARLGAPAFKILVPNIITLVTIRKFTKTNVLGTSPEFSGAHSS
jgi:uncharacterized protein YaaW (UPF0174 family)